MSKSYAELLKDPRWQRKRLEVMERDDFACARCLNEDKTLHVHHLFYKKGAKPWEYKKSELITLCEVCHKEVEDEMFEIQRQISKFNEPEIQAITYLVKYVNDKRNEKLAEYCFKTIGYLLPGIALVEQQ